ncbi:flagella synthesis protein FlgN [Nitrosomonas sp. wSCUT-2]
MPSYQDSFISVSTTLLEEMKALRSFIEILKKEEQVLIEGKIEEIDFYSSEKSRLIEILTQFNDQREKYLKTQDIDLDKNCMNNLLIKQNSDQNRIIDIWNELLDLAWIAKKLNQSNGLIIIARYQHHQRALAAIHSAAGNVSCYGPKGQPCI